ncbi:hypothetical protein HTZ84_09750 [Haloterrigena sp. SYSU A558-1]|uniref:Homing endonuclease LAGLIDADG domain-containing protein n=1 Tax=Haloterrigena gelatinilytica TaxID=2741724 RepID=A0ABX2LBP7_9EURY|nr:hypothetical protein [Haloterrigena gelatinilytica]NUC72589.1 hypothetical protein [Haloterrigena gelatinilytica]
MPENDWRAVYAAGALDWGGHLKASLRKKGSSKHGYEVLFEITFKKSSMEAVGLLDEFFTDMGLNPKASVDEREGGDQYVVRLTRRDEVREVLEVVFPFLAARHEQAQILLEDVFPALDEGRHREAEGMVEVASMLDRVQEEGFQRGGSHKKYDAETVAGDLGVDL